MLDTDPDPPSKAVLTLQCDTRKSAPDEQHTDRQPPALAALARHLAGDLDAIILKALRREPQARYASVEALRRDLEAHLANRPVSARRSNRRYVLQKYVRRHRAGLIAAAAAVFAMIAGLAGVAAQARVTTRERDRALAAEAGTFAINEYLVGELLAAPTPAKSQGRPLSVADVLANASRSVGFAFASQPRLEAQVRSTLARSYLALGQLAEARTHATAAREALGRLAAPDHDAELRARVLIAQVTLDEGRYSEARRELEPIVAEQESLGARTRADTLIARGLLARALREESNLVQAAREVRSALADAASHQGGNWRLIADLQTELVRVLILQENGLEAERLAGDLLERRTHHLGPVHPDVLLTLRLQADTLGVLLKHREALTVKQRLVSLNEEIYGANHPETARALSSLAVTFDRVDLEDDSQAAANRALEIFKNTLGPDHAEAVSALRHVGLIYGRLASTFPKAEAIYRQVLELNARARGEHHVATIMAGGDLTFLYARNGRLREARAAAIDVIRRCAEVAARAEVEPVTVDRCAQFFLDAEPKDLRSPARALELSERAVAAEERRHYLRLATLARAHQALGQPIEAMAVLREALDLPQAIQSWSAEARFVTLMMQYGTVSDLERWLLDRLERFRTLRGPDDHFMAYTLAHLGRLYVREGRLAEAEARFAERLAQLRKSAPESNWQVARARTELGERMVARGAYAEAEPLLLRGMTDLQADRFVSATLLEEARDRLVELYVKWGRPADAAAWKTRSLR